MEVDGWFRSLPSAAPKMDAREWSTLDRGACRDHLRVGRESTLKILDILDVISVRVVRTEPR